MPCSRYMPSAAAVIATLALGFSATSCDREKPPSDLSSVKRERDEAPRVTAASAEKARTSDPAPAQATAAAKPAVIPPGKTDDPCPEICDRTTKLGCGPRGACMTACAQVNDGSICPAEMSAFMGCALKHPAEHWECSENGVAAIRDGYCDAEQLQFMRCFQTAAATTK